MLSLVFLTLVTFSSGQRLPRNNISFVTLPNNPYIRLFTNDSAYPTRIKFLQDIKPESQLMSRIIYPDYDDDDDTSESTVSMRNKDNRRNLCDILDITSNDRIIREWEYLVRYALGLQGENCPIQKGVRPIEPSISPALWQTDDEPVVQRFFVIRIEQMDQPLESDPIMEFRGEWSSLMGEAVSNQTSTEKSSSSTVSFSMLIPSLIIGLFVMKFMK